MAKRTKKNPARNLLKIEALEQRQLLAGGFTEAQGQEFSDITHANGLVYDQVLLKTSAITVTNDPGQITRVSFLDLQGDIVQAEFSGPGTLSISLDQFSGPAEAAKYNQPGIEYVSGLASFTIQGSEANTHFTVFSVGTATAHGGAENTIFDGGLFSGGNNTADVARLTIVADPANPGGSTFGGIRAGNAVFSADSGVVGIAAAGVQVQDVVTVGDINATGTAIPTLVFGANSQFGAVTVAGGDLVSDNGIAINNVGSYEFRLTLAAGTTSGGVVLPAQPASPQLVFEGENPFAAANKIITLTTGVDTATGGAGNDTINGILDTAGGTSTLTVLDTIDGLGGTDTLSLLDLDAAGSTQPAGVTLSNVEIVNLRAVGVVNIDTSDWDGVTNLNVTQGTSATVEASDETAIVVAGITTGPVVVDGGSTVNVSTAAGAVTVGGTTEPDGAVTVTHTNQGANAIAVDGGTSVTVTASKVAAGTVTIGAASEPSGAVVVNSTGANYTSGYVSAALGAIAIDGGSTVTVVQKAAGSTTAAATDTSAATVTQSAVTVTGTDDTTSVSVTQDPAVTAVNAVIAAAGSVEKNVVTFTALTAGQNTQIDGLTFTASKNLTAAQVAAAFANLSAGATTGSAPASNGIYSGTLIAGWTSGAASTADVTFTATSAGDKTDLDVTLGGVDPSVVKTDGTTATSATTGKMGVVGGAVTINDATNDTIASVTLSGYGAGSAITSDVLTSLSLANSAQAVTVNNTAATTLGLTVNNLATGANLNDASGTYETLNVTATGANSNLDIDAAAVTALTVNGDKVLTVNAGSTLTALETVTVSGTAGLNLGTVGATTIESINASGTSGAITASIDPTLATYSGSSGVDTVTLTATGPTKAISLGGGDDVLTLAAGTTTSTSTLDGGAGSDTLKMAVTDAAAVTADGLEAKITGFERLELTTFGGAAYTVNLENLDDINYVIAGGLAATDVLNVDGMASGGTLAVTAANNAAATIDVDLKDATGSADSLNVVVSNTNGIEAGVLNLAGIESATLTVTDTSTSAIGTHSLTLTANDLTSLVVNGNAHLNLTLSGTTDSLTVINAKTMTGALTATTNGVVAQTIEAGGGADVLTANFQGDVLHGNGGADTLKVNGKSLVSLSGGAGNDTFDVSVATTNVNSYATITDLAAGDMVKFSAAAADFNAAAIVLDPTTAVFQDYANAAIASSAAGDVSWFQYNGNTYIVQNVAGGASFTNGTDVIVKVTGLVNLNTAAFSSSTDTLVII